MGRWGISWPVPWLVFSIVYGFCMVDSQEWFKNPFQEVQGRVMELILLQHLGEMEEDMVATPVVLEVINGLLPFLSFFPYIERALLLLEVVNDHFVPWKAFFMMEYVTHCCWRACNKANFRW